LNCKEVKRAETDKKLMPMNKALHPKADADKLYILEEKIGV